MIGAGGQAGQGDAANLLKPALARGELRTIAATTWAEYKKYFEKDAALARRFQVVKVEEPDEDQRHPDDARPDRDAGEAPRGAHPRRGRRELRCKLSHRYITGRQLPDKSVSLLDTACARVAISQNADPAGRRGLPAPRSSTSRSRSASSSAKRPPAAEHAERLAEVQKALEAGAETALADAGGALGGRERSASSEIRGAAPGRSRPATPRRRRRRRRQTASRRPALRRAGRHAGRPADPSRRAAHAPGRDRR